MPELTDAELADLMAAIGLTEPRRGAKAVQPCGTQAAYVRHLRHGQEPCEDCKAAHAERGRRIYATRTPTPTVTLSPIRHGTPAGARQHWYRKVPICGKCQDAYNAAQRSRRRARRTYLTEEQWQARSGPGDTDLTP